MAEQHKDDYYWLNDNAREFLSRGYLLEGTTAEERVRDIAERAEELLQGMYERENGTLADYPKLIDEFADRFEHNMARGYYSLASPIWSNFALDRGLPISCFGSYIGDSVKSIMKTHAEVGMMTKVGGGTSGYFGDVRPRGAKITNNGTSNGTYPFAQLFDKLIDVVSQGSCYVEGTKVLTNNGYKDFRDVDPATDKIAQVDERNNVTFTNEYELVEQDFTGELDVYEGLKKPEAFSLKVTPNHRMVVEREKRAGWPGYTEIEKSEDLNLHRNNRMYLTGTVDNSQARPFTMRDRLRVAFQADGRKDGPNRRIRFRFRKERKIKRMQWILEELGWEYETNERKGGTVEIATDFVEDIKFTDFRDWVDLEEIDVAWINTFIEEIAHWDGTFRKGQKDLVGYDTTDYHNAEFVAALCALAGKKARIVTKSDRPGNRVDIYRVNICNKQYRGGDSIEQRTETYDGKVYCAIVPKGRLIVQHNGVSAICGNTRRGHFAGYIPIEHGDIEEWLNIQHPGDKIQTMMYGVTVGDEWLQEMIDGDQKKREIWGKVLQNRSGEIGAPYILFRDNANRNKPQVYKDKEKQILASNLCSEIMLPSDEEESFVCCLSSINASRYREWEDTDAVRVLTYFLDAVMEEFIQKARKIPYLNRAVNFARRQRAIGIGVLGWHTLLQQERIPFDSMDASMLNARLFKQIREESYTASEDLASHFGEPRLMKGYGRRNATTMAVAPTKSSSYILGQVSQGIEPIKTNYFVRDAAKKQSTFKNPRLEALLEEKGENTRETWRKIKADQGSVQNLDCLTDHEKDVFRTFGEIPQLAVVKQAAQRQQFIDQSQSLNLAIDPKEMPAKDINALYLEAWKLGVKSLYYQKSSNAAQSFAASHMECRACGS